MKRMLSFIFAVLLILGLSACGSDPNQDIIDRSKKILDEIDDVQEKSDYVSGLIDQYKNGK